MSLKFIADTLSFSKKDKDWLKEYSYDKSSIDKITIKNQALLPTKNHENFAKLLLRSSNENFPGGDLISIRTMFRRSKE